MPPKKHGRPYDVVLFGATGYTGKFTAECIAAHLPTNLKWAVAGRSRDKLKQVVDRCSALHPDRAQPAIELCSLSVDELSALAKKTFILVTTVGPYGAYGEPAFQACAEAGTHYLDATGEVPFVARMIRKYEAVAKASGAAMFPQIGVDSAPADLITRTLVTALKSSPGAPDTRDVTLSVYKIDASASGGTLASILGALDNFTLSELFSSFAPFALSPVPNPRASAWPRSITTAATGLVRCPDPLGLQTTSLTGRMDGSEVERTWGLQQQPGGLGGAAQPGYGARFTFREYTSARNWLYGLAVHWAILLLGLAIAVPPLRAVVRLALRYRPGEGPTNEDIVRHEVEYRGIAEADKDGPVTERAYCRAWYKGSVYQMTGFIIAQALATFLEDGFELGGGIYTPTCLGLGFTDRLDRYGFHFETQMIPA